MNRCRHSPDDLAAADRRPRGVAGESVAQQGQGAGVASLFDRARRGPTATSVTPWRLPELTRTSPARSVVPVLTPLTNRARPRSRLVLMTWRTMDPSRSVALRVSTICPEEAIAQEDAGEIREVAGARVVGGVVEPDRGRVVGVAQPETPGGAVHHRHECGHRAGDAVGEVHGSIVAARQQHSVEEVVNAVRSPGPQAQQGLAALGVVCRGVQPLAGRRCPSARYAVISFVADAIGRRAPGVVRGEHLAVAGIDDDPGARLRVRVPPPRRRDERRQDQRQEAPRPPRGGEPGAGLAAAVGDDVQLLAGLEALRVEPGAAVAA